MRLKSAVLMTASAVTLIWGTAVHACEIKLGATGPLSGAATQWGLAIKGATDFVAAEVKANGGLKVGGDRPGIGFRIAQTVIAASGKLGTQCRRIALCDIGKDEILFELIGQCAGGLLGLRQVECRRARLYRRIRWIRLRHRQWRCTRQDNRRHDLAHSHASHA